MCTQEIQSGRDGKSVLPQVEELYQRAALLDPQLFSAHENLGKLFYFTARYERAAAEWRECLRLHPQSGDSHNMLAKSLLRLSRFSEALPHFQEALRLEASEERRAIIRRNMDAATAQLGG